MNIRKLEKNDFHSYLGLISQFRPITVDIDQTKFNEIYEAIFNRGSEIYVAIDDDGKMLGSITVIYEQKFIHNLSVYAHIEDVIVDENHRHLRIGSKLLDFVKLISKDKNCFKLSLVCNENVKKFYAVNDFDERGINMSFLL